MRTDRRVSGSSSWGLRGGALGARSSTGVRFVTVTGVGVCLQRAACLGNGRGISFFQGNTVSLFIFSS